MQLDATYMNLDATQMELICNLDANFLIEAQTSKFALAVD